MMNFLRKITIKKTQIKKNYEIISSEDLNLLKEASKSQILI